MFILQIAWEVLELNIAAQVAAEKAAAVHYSSTHVGLHGTNSSHANYQGMYCSGKLQAKISILESIEICIDLCGLPFKR